MYSVPVRFIGRKVRVAPTLTQHTSADVISLRSRAPQFGRGWCPPFVVPTGALPPVRTYSPGLALAQGGAARASAVGRESILSEWSWAGGLLSKAVPASGAAPQPPEAHLPRHPDQDPGTWHRARLRCLDTPPNQ